MGANSSRLSETLVPYLRVDTNEALGLGVELLLQRNNNGLEVARGLLLDVVSNLYGRQEEERGEQENYLLQPFVYLSANGGNNV